MLLHYSACNTVAADSIHLSASHSLFPPVIYKILQDTPPPWARSLPWPEESMPVFFSRRKAWPWTLRCWFLTQPLHAQEHNIWVCAWSPLWMAQKKLHHLQITGMLSLASHTWHLSNLGRPVISCRGIPQSGVETRRPTLDPWVRHPP